MYRYIIAILMVLLLSSAPAMAKDWYVRPAGGDYGQENGTSYEDAWDGLTSIVLGAGGVSPGDVLWICGTHLHKATTTKNIATQAQVLLISGTGESARITIRGDYEADPGKIFNAFIPAYAPWVKESGNVWSIEQKAYHYADFFYEQVKDYDYRVLDKATSLEEVQNKPGSFYSPNYAPGNKLYVHCSDSGDPTDRVLLNRFGYKLFIGTNSYITVKGLTFFSFSGFWGRKNDPTHIKIDGNKFFFGESRMFSLYDGMDYIDITNNEIGWAGTAIYTISETDTGGPSYYNFSGNYIHDIGVRPIQQNSDAHCVGIQGGKNGVIDSNTCVNCGTGPLLYVWESQEIENTVVTRNFVKDLHTLGNATGYGVSTMCTNSSVSKKSGIIMAYNVVINSPVGYRLQFEQVQEFYNNVAYNCGVGLKASRTFEDKGPSIKSRNNIFVNSKLHHVHFATGGVNSLLDFDKNIYFPDGPELFALVNVKTDFKGWQEWKTNWHMTSYTFDPNSIIIDPQFVDPENENFNIKSSSPAIGLGVTVGYDSDKAGNPVGEPPAVGAYEYVTVPAPTEPATAPEETTGDDTVVVEETTTEPAPETTVLTSAEIKDRDRLVSQMIFEKQLQYYNMTQAEWDALSADEQKLKAKQYGRVFHKEELVYHDIVHKDWQKLTFDQIRELRWKQTRDWFGLDENWEKTG